MFLSEQKIIEGNELIAPFDGWKDNDGVGYSKGSRLLLKEEFKYHSSPNWILPVVEHIETNLHKTFVIAGKTCSIPELSIVIAPDPGLHFSKTEVIWLCVVEFVKWYNKHKLE